MSLNGAGIRLNVRFGEHPAKADDDGTARLVESAPSWEQGVRFEICYVDPRVIAVTFEPVANDRRTEISQRKPEWLDAIVFANLVSRADANQVVLTLVSDVARHLAHRALAAALVSHRLLDLTPNSYVVNVPGSRVIISRLEFEYDRGEGSFNAQVVIEQGT